MNILILGNFPPPYGGVPHHIKLLSNYLANNNNNVYVIAGGNGKNFKKENLEVFKYNLCNKFYYFFLSIFNKTFYTILASNKITFNSVKYFLRLKIFYKIAECLIKSKKIDIVLSYNLFYYSPIAYELNLRYDIPYIVNVFGEIYRLKELKNNEKYYLKILNNSKINISCSIHCAKSIELLNYNNIKCNSILYGIDLKIFKHKENIIEKKTKIGFFGRIDTEMGVDIFKNIIIAMSNYDLNYVIAGQKGNYYYEIENFKNTNKFKIETYYNVNTELLADLYNDCKIVIVPTRGLRTCSSLATMEAMACGCVVIGHNIGGIPELINEQTGILVNFENIKMFTESINKVLNSEIITKEYRRNSIDYAINNFSELKMCDNFYKLIID